ncbi:MAG: flagellar FlbD family protein [Eubacteriales bacterium]
MITLTKLNEESFILNSDLIEIIEERPDTTIQLVSGEYFLVAESAAEIVKRIIAYKRKLYRK